MSRSLLALIVAALTLAGGCQDKTSQPAGGAAVATKPYTREEFRDKVIGKTGPQVIEAIGRPKEATDNPDGTPGIWYYYDIVHNPSTGKTGWALVRFKNGVVSEVTW